MALIAVRRALDVALGLFVLAVVLVALSANLAPHVDARLLAIRSGSMQPSIPVGSVVAVGAIDPDQLAVGDVVTVSLEGGAVLTHRIESIVESDGERRLRLKGDANPVSDPVLVGASAVVGRVEWSLPLLGYLLAMLAMPTGIAALLSMGGALFAAGWLLDDLANPGEGHAEAAPSLR